MEESDSLENAYLRCDKMGQSKLLQARYKITQGLPILLPEEEEAAIEALRNDQHLRGENVAKFEEEFAKMVGVDHAITTNSGTDALVFILIALGSNGKKVITTPMSFIASANSIIHAGGIPSFADIDVRNYCLDPLATEQQLKLVRSTILPVHLFGHPVDFEGFEDLRKRYDSPIVEDACQAHGAEYCGRRVGSLGDAAAFSFYPSKNMTVLGDGGMVTTNDKKIADVVSRIRDGGRVSWYEHDILGYTSRMNSVSAAIGRVQLKHLLEWNNKRRLIASMYEKSLREISQVILPSMGDKKCHPVFHQFVIQIDKRDELKSYLELKGIQCGIHYPIPIHLQPLYSKLFRFREGNYPKSETFAKKCLSLPIHPLLSAEDVSYVCDTIRSFFATERN